MLEQTMPEILVVCIPFLTLTLAMIIAGIILVWGSEEADRLKRFPKMLLKGGIALTALLLIIMAISMAHTP